VVIVNKKSKTSEEKKIKLQIRNSKYHLVKLVIKLKKQLFLNIKKRSKAKGINNELSQDLGKIDLRPEDLIFIEFIDKNINQK
jgi:hypothetical protein